MEEQKYAIWKKLHEAKGNLAFSLAVFGDKLAARENYKTLGGIEAVHFYLIHKFNWLPSQVKSMSTDDMLFVLQEEMEGYVLPKEARL